MRHEKKALLAELTRVSVIFLALYVLQSQILQVRSDVYGRTSGLAEAQARTAWRLSDAQQSLQSLRGEQSRNVRDAAREATGDLEVCLRQTLEETQDLRRLLQNRLRELESDLARSRASGEERLGSLKALAEENSRNLDTLRSSVRKDSEVMKRSMLFPTAQLRGNGTVGSGVLIYSEPQPGVGNGDTYTTFALTASHVVQEVTGAPLEMGQSVSEVRIFSDVQDDALGTVYTGTVMYFDDDRDIALLRIDSPERFPYLASLSTRTELDALDVFSPAYAVGCPLGNRPMPTWGEISSKTKLVGEHNFWMLNAPTFFGNSGGGVYQTRDCRLIGVSSMIYTYGKKNPAVVPHMGLFVPLEAIYRWFDETGLSFLAARGPIPEALRPRLAYQRPQKGENRKGRGDDGDAGPLEIGARGDRPSEIAPVERSHASDSP